MKIFDKPNDINSTSYVYNSGWQKIKKDTNKGNELYNALSEKVARIDEEVNKFKEKNEVSEGINNVSKIQEDGNINVLIDNTNKIMNEIDNIKDEIIEIKNLINNCININSSSNKYNLSNIFKKK